MELRRGLLLAIAVAATGVESLLLQPGAPAAIASQRVATSSTPHRPDTARRRVFVASAPGSGGDGGGAPQKLSRWQRFVVEVQEKGPKMLMGGDMSREKLQKLGLSMLLSYGWVSNCNMAFILIVSWITFGKSTGLSPLAVGQWPSFLAVYMGLWLAANFLRPARLAAAAAMSPLFDRLLNFFQRLLSIEKHYAVLLTLFLVNVVGTLTLVCGGLFVATTITGTPLLPAGVGLRQYLFKA